MESRSASSSTSIARGANLPPIVACKTLITVGLFSFSRSNLILGWVGFLEFLRRVWKVIITMSWLLPTSAPGDVLVLAVLILNGTVSSPRGSQSGCDVFHLGCAMSIFWMAYGCLGCLPAQGCCRLRSLGAWALCHWSQDCRKVHKLLPNLLVIFCICAIADDKVCDSCIVSFWPNSNFLCCVITQNGDLLLAVTNRKALAPGGTAPRSPPPESSFKTLITLLPVTFSQLDPQLGVLVVEKGEYFDRLSFNQWLNCLTVKYLAGWHL